MSDTKIEWTDSTWTPIRARVRMDAAEIVTAKGYTSLVQIAAKQAGHVGAQCERCSDGCDNCYSETFQARCLPHNGTGLPFDRRSRDLVEYFFDEEMLLQPLKWRKPRKVFVCSQTDLFGEWVPDEWIDRIFAVMALCPHVTFQVLTKRAERMHRWSQHLDGDEDPKWQIEAVRDSLIEGAAQNIYEARNPGCDPSGWLAVHQPLPNVWLGVSCENQEQADARIPHLLRTPAAVRFLSCEPLLGPLKLKFMRNKCLRCCDMPERFTDNPNGSFKSGSPLRDEARQSVWCPACGFFYDDKSEIKWVIVGGESGPGARPCNIEWIRGIVRQCKAAGVPVFVKQLGSNPDASTEILKASTVRTICGRFSSGETFQELAEDYEVPIVEIEKALANSNVFWIKDKKGGDMSEWPEDVRVRESPKGVTK